MHIEACVTIQKSVISELIKCMFFFICKEQSIKKKDSCLNKMVWAIFFFL